jgi:hypothetical protein
MAIICAYCNRHLTSQQAGSPCPQCGSLDRNLTAKDQAKLVKEKTRVAKDLAKKHYRSETGLTRIFRLTGTAEVEVRPAEPIKLLEVNDNTFASGVRPLQFGPAPASGVPFPSVIVEVTPEEFTRIQSDELKLPRGWTLGEELPKPPPDEAGGD